MSTMEVQKLSLKYKKLKKYFPAEILYSHFHNTKSVFLDSSLKNKYGKYSVIGLYPYLEVKESNNILKINDKETKGNLLDFLDIVAKFFCECFSNSMEIFAKKCSGFTKKY